MSDQDAMELRRLIRRWGHGKVILELIRFIKAEAQFRPALCPVVSSLKAAHYAAMGFPRSK